MKLNFTNIAKKIIYFGNLIRIFRGDCNPIYSKGTIGNDMSGANHELKFRDDFIEYFGNKSHLFFNSIICDHGSGYGGKTIHYAETF